MSRIALIIFLLALLPRETLADQRLRDPIEFKGGMQHTYVRKQPPAPIAETEKTTEQAQETPASRVWTKYKALAAGKGKEFDEQQAAQTQEQAQSAKDNAKTAQTEASAPPPPTGFAAILQQYQSSRNQRSQMKSIQMTKPQVAEPETPNVPKPQKPATP